MLVPGYCHSGMFNLAVTSVVCCWQADQAAVCAVYESSVVPPCPHLTPTYPHLWQMHTPSTCLLCSITAACECASCALCFGESLSSSKSISRCQGPSLECAP